MSETYVRVDDRLIHGQTIVAWCPTLGIKQIIAIDDVSASNPMLRSILAMSVPKIYDTHIVTVEEARELLQTPCQGNRLVIVKFPEKLMEIQQEIAGCEQIYLGNIAKRADTNHQMTGATGIFYLSDQDVANLNTLAVSGFKIAFQQLPTSTRTEWDSFVKSL
ncbi:PTS system mannose/fructose/N-acetylgalactosamine-transporter subunit IIB [Fournierella massiliensis]|uniref:PTS system mannose/fructose/N-acetylgalactosamine-transporter subunit IIB n=1 Tax=Allofournierella massiliensis TaxID=1650663 RepID=UPI003520FCB8